MISTEGASNVATDIMNKLQNSYDMVKFAAKKQLLGNAAAKVGSYITVPVINITETRDSEVVDSTSGEEFLKQIKMDIESAQFPSENCIAGELIGGAPELVLYVKKGIIPSLEVTTWSGAFNRGDLAVPARIEIVDDFGDNEDVVALLADSRAIKLHNGYNAVRSKENATGDFINFVRHFEWTGFISKYAFIKAYKQA